MPSFAGPQTPSGPPFCFCAAAQAWQVPVQAVSQQTPPAQNPDAHSRHPGSLQCARVSHVAPWALRGWHVPSGAQWWVVAHCASELHEVGQEALAPSHA
jgi:hypothetical protein